TPGAGELLQPPIPFLRRGFASEDSSAPQSILASRATASGDGPFRCAPTSRAAANSAILPGLSPRRRGSNGALSTGVDSQKAASWFW
ncbi:unnamed protein product, partial [Urochloa humidicola]